MAARSMWKGMLRLSMLSVPVKLYKATDESEKVSFHQLHKGCGARIRYKKVCDMGHDVEAVDIIKGFEIEEGKHIEVLPEELTNLKLESNHAIEIVGMVHSEEIPMVHISEPFFLAPDPKMGGNKPYALLFAAMRERGLVGLGKVVMRDREQFLAIRAEEGGMMLYALRYNSEVRDLSELKTKLTTTEAIGGEELELTKQLVGMYETEWDELAPQVVDHYNDAVIRLIERKRSGEVVETTSTEAPAVRPANVLDMLKLAVAAKKPEAVEVVAEVVEAKPEAATGKGRKKKAA